MTSSEFYSLIKQQFPFEPTLKQNIVLNQLSEFIFDKHPNALYLLKGYAGTGKTTILKHFLRPLLGGIYQAATGGTTVTYAAPFIGGASGMSVPAVQLTIVNASAGDDIILSSETLNGFNVQVLNGGTGVVRTVNYLAQGY